MAEVREDVYMLGNPSDLIVSCLGRVGLFLSWYCCSCLMGLSRSDSFRKESFQSSVRPKYIPKTQPTPMSNENDEQKKSGFP
jgi:hypothetical protein